MKNGMTGETYNIGGNTEMENIVIVEIENSRRSRNAKKDKQIQHEYKEFFYLHNFRTPGWRIFSG